MRRAAEPRLVRLKRIHVELGVQICGGNLSGIFVESLDDDSPAKCPDGLLPGDLILEVPAVFRSLFQCLTTDIISLSAGFVEYRQHRVLYNLLLLLLMTHFLPAAKFSFLYQQCTPSFQTVQWHQHEE